MSPIPYFVLRWEVIRCRQKRQKIWVRVLALSPGPFPSWFWCQISVCFESAQFCLPFIPCLIAISSDQGSFSNSRRSEALEEIFYVKNLVQWLLWRVGIWCQRRSKIEEMRVCRLISPIWVAMDLLNWKSHLSIVSCAFAYMIEVRGMALPKRGRSQHIMNIHCGSGTGFIFLKSYKIGIMPAWEKFW